MTWFVIIAAVMTAMALAWVVPPLLRRRGHGGMVSRQGSNLAVLRDQLAELDADLRNGTIAPEQHARARGELERRTLEDATVDPQAGGGEKAGGRAAAVLVGILIPSLALLLYLLTGNPDGLEPAGIHGDAAATPAQVEQMVSRLAARLEASPDDPNGWSLLGRSYYAMGRYAEAVKAYARAVQLNSEDAGLYADYADALAMSLGRRVDDQVLLLVNQALKIDPDHLKALVMGASAAFDRQDYKTALTYLERLQRQVPPDTQLGRMVAERAEEVRARAGGKTEAPVAGKTEGTCPGQDWSACRRSGVRTDDQGARRSEPCAGGESRCHGHCVHSGPRAPGPAHAARGDAAPGKGSSLRIHAGGRTGDVAGNEALEVQRGGHRRARIEERQCDPPKRRSAGRHRQRQAWGEQRQRCNRYGRSLMPASVTSEPENGNSATEDTENTERFKDLNRHAARTRLVRHSKHLATLIFLCELCDLCG